MRALDALPRIAEVSAEAARQAGSLALSLFKQVAGSVLDRRSQDRDSGWTRNWEPPSSRPVGEPPPPPSTPRRPPATSPAARPAPPAAAAPPAPTPEHVDREAVVVAESADAGAGDGAGAEVNVAEPWRGYAKLNAKDVMAQLATADPATLAVVRLYESSQRNRKTVLADIDRRLKTAGS